MSFHLADEVMLGQYEITLPSYREKKTFTVEEYVSKRFEVNIKAPKVIGVRDKSFHLEICGRYTYGKPVEGYMDIFVYHKHRWTSKGASTEGEEDDNAIKIKHEKADSNGCITKDISFGKFNISRSSTSQTVGIKALLTEDQTGHTEQATAEVFVNLYKKILFPKEVFYYQKGLPYRNKVRSKCRMWY
ncbi:hypothetical protein GDO81_004250 [Engystomops pustulosus]|uniref:Macroglobulin domain-containing protein n=1 Tax=Engystomops pustulosus TaxID=76066 RepID=A0AAV6ZR70_ENGPU|nr:hypothetical protein GDO81_004250 [Engystomops pustulosus]